ncbi:MAG TPA: amidohydrolase family protein, partial [Candidatus Limnocylindrales bacterium]
MASELVIRNGTLITSSGQRRADIAIANGLVAAIAEDVGPGTDAIDARGLFILPGLIDGHVHFREPGLEHEETWLTGSLSAAMGGVTTVLDMPNTIPPTDTIERVRDKLARAARSSYVDFGVFGLLGESAESVAEIASSGLLVGLKVFMGPTTGGLRAPDDEGMRRALKIAREVGLRVAFH